MLAQSHASHERVQGLVLGPSDSRHHRRSPTPRRQRHSSALIPAPALSNTQGLARHEQTRVRDGGTPRRDAGLRPLIREQTRGCTDGVLVEEFAIPSNGAGSVRFSAGCSGHGGVYYSVIEACHLLISSQTTLMSEAARCLDLSEAEAKKYAKANKSRSSNESERFPVGIEWEILLADAVVLRGMVHALRCVLSHATACLLRLVFYTCSESYVGYAQCL